MNFKFSIKEMSIVAIFTALTSVMAQISIPLPFSPVPITFQLFAIFLSSIILSSRLATTSQIIYVLLGAIGIPVFANFSGGLHTIVGPTGGFIISFPIMAFIASKASKKKKSLFVLILGLIASLMICYAIGVIQLSFITKMSISKGVMIAVVPFIPLDVIKIFLAYVLGIKIKDSLKRANLLEIHN